MVETRDACNVESAIWELQEPMPSCLSATYSRRSSRFVQHSGPCKLYCFVTSSYHRAVRLRAMRGTIKWALDFWWIIRERSAPFNCLWLACLCLPDERSVSTSVITIRIKLWDLRLRLRITNISCPILFTFVESFWCHIMFEKSCDFFKCVKPRR